LGSLLALDVPMNYNLKKQHKRSESMGHEF